MATRLISAAALLLTISCAVEQKPVEAPVLEGDSGDGAQDEGSIESDADTDADGDSDTDAASASSS